MLQNKVLLLFLLFSLASFSQEKKVDTVYVYEEIIIYDTIYIEKPIDKIKLENVVFIKSELNKKYELQAIQNGKIVSLLIDSSTVKFQKNKGFQKSWFVGGKFLTAIAHNSFFEQFNAK